MSKTLAFDGLGGNATFVVTDAEYDEIDFGNNNEGSVQFETVDGSNIVFNLAFLIFCRVTGLSPTRAEVLPRHKLIVRAHGGSVGVTIDATEKAAVLALLSGPGSENLLAKVEAVDGDILYIPNANLTYLEIHLDTTPEPE